MNSQIAKARAYTALRLILRQLLLILLIAYLNRDMWQNNNGQEISKYAIFTSILIESFLILTVLAFLEAAWRCLHHLPLEKAIGWRLLNLRYRPYGGAKSFSSAAEIIMKSKA